MADAKESSVEDDDDKQKVLEEKISELRSVKKDLFEKARPINDELETIAKHERQCVDELHRLTAEKHGRDQQQTAVRRLIELESEMKRVRCENVKLKQSLDQAAKQSTAQLHKITELEKRLTPDDHVDEDDVALSELQKELDDTRQLLNITNVKFIETRQHLSDVQERLAVAEQVTAATQQRALQEAGNNSEELLELTAQHQPTRQTGSYH